MRRIGVDDWGVWRELRLKALEEAPGAFAATLAEWQGAGDSEQRWRGRLAGVPLNVVAMVDGRAGGMVSATGPDGERRIELISMWVAPWARGRGVGDALIAEVIRWSGEQQAARVFLNVVDGNGPAIALYRRNGFVDGGWGDLSRDGRRERVMIRELHRR
jgi:ribosomal protein S18 acetylase RimI-like enzyme